VPATSWQVLSMVKVTVSLAAVISPSGIRRSHGQYVATTQPFLFGGNLLAGSCPGIRQPPWFSSAMSVHSGGVVITEVRP
jgi:hypothetical protein